MEIDLAKRNAVVTGATGQLGRTMVQLLAECGANVGICYSKNEKFANELKDEIEEKFNVKAVAVQVDVTNLDSIKSMKSLVNSKLGTIDIIVNNAVIQLDDWYSVIEQPPEDFKSQFESCVMQSVYMAKVFIPDMKKQKYGRVIGINTECIMQSFTTQSAYVSGKRGMDGVLRVLAREVGQDNITVNQIAPGWTISDASRNHDGTEKNINQDFVYKDRVPMKRRGTDIEVANAVCFLASDLAGFITGALIPIAGGNVMVCV